MYALYPSLCSEWRIRKLFSLPYKNIIKSLFPQTPLHYAAVRGSVECIHVLLQFGADVTAKEVKRKKFFCGEFWECGWRMSGLILGFYLTSCQQKAVCAHSLLFLSSYKVHIPFTVYNVARVNCLVYKQTNFCMIDNKLGGKEIYLHFNVAIETKSNHKLSSSILTFIMLDVQRVCHKIKRDEK